MRWENSVLQCSYVVTIHLNFRVLNSDQTFSLPAWHLAWFCAYQYTVSVLKVSLSNRLKNIPSTSPPQNKIHKTNFNIAHPSHSLYWKSQIPRTFFLHFNSPCFFSCSKVAYSMCDVHWGMIQTKIKCCLLLWKVNRIIVFKLNNKSFLNLVFGFLVFKLNNKKSFLNLVFY